MGDGLQGSPLEKIASVPAAAGNSARRYDSSGVLRKFKRKDQDQAVNVHIIKLQELPDPLSMLEFREHCQNKGLPFEVGKQRSASQDNLENPQFNQFKNIYEKRAKDRMNKIGSNLFGAYMGIYDVFKSWHKGMIQQREFGPKNLENHKISQQPLPPFMSPKQELTEKETLHLIRQKELVNLLIQHSIGISKEVQDSDQIIQDIDIIEPNDSVPGQIIEQNSISEEQSNQDFIGGQSSAEKQPFTLPGGFIIGNNTSPCMKKSGTVAYRTQSAFNLNDQFPSLVDQNDQKLQEYQSRRSMDNESNKFDDHAQSSIINSLNPGETKKVGMSPRSVRFNVIQKNTSLITVENEENNIQQQVADDQGMGNATLTNAYNAEAVLAQSSKAQERMRVVMTPAESIFDGRMTNSRGRAGTINFTKNSQNILNVMKNKGKHIANKVMKKNEQDLQLRKELADTKQHLAEVKSQLIEAEKRNIKTMSNMFKDNFVNTHKDKLLKMPAPQQAAAIRGQITSQFVNVTDGLEPHVVEIMNVRLESMKQYFVEQIRLVSHHADSLRQNIALVESMNKDGIKFADLDTPKLIEKIAQIEELKREQNQNLQDLDPSQKNRALMNRPQVIWNLMHDHFGSDYFLDIIAEEYGMLPGSNELLGLKIQEHFDNQIQVYKDLMFDLEKNVKEKVEFLVQQVDDLNVENDRLSRQDQKKLDLVMSEMRVNIHAKYKEQEKNLIKSYETKLKSAKHTIFEMNQQRDKHYISQKGMQQKYAFKKWQMFRTISNLIQSQEDKKDCCDELSKKCDKFIQSEQLILRNFDKDQTPPQLLREYEQIEEALQWKQKWEESQESLKWHQNRADYNAARLEESCSQIKTLKIQYTNGMYKLKALEKQNEMYEENLKQKAEENIALGVQVKHIEGRWRTGTKEPHKFTARPIIEALRLRSLDEYSTFFCRGSRAVRRGEQHQVNVSTITKINNISKKLPELQVLADNESQTQAVYTRHNEQQTSPKAREVIRISTSRVNESKDTTMQDTSRILGNSKKRQQNPDLAALSTKVQNSQLKHQISRESTITQNMGRSKSFMVSGHLKPKAFNLHNNQSIDKRMRDSEDSKLLTDNQNSNLARNVNEVLGTDRSQSQDDLSSNLFSTSLKRASGNHTGKTVSNFGNSTKNLLQKSRQTVAGASVGSKNSSQVHYEIPNVPLTSRKTMSGWQIAALSSSKQKTLAYESKRKSDDIGNTLNLQIKGSNKPKKNLSKTGGVPSKFQKVTSSKDMAKISFINTAQDLSKLNKNMTKFKSKREIRATPIQSAIKNEKTGANMAALSRSKSKHVGHMAMNSGDTGRKSSYTKGMTTKTNNLTPGIISVPNMLQQRAQSFRQSFSGKSSGKNGLLPRAFTNATPKQLNLVEQSSNSALQNPLSAQTPQESYIRINTVGLDQTLAGGGSAIPRMTLDSARTGSEQLTPIIHNIVNNNGAQTLKNVNFASYLQPEVLPDHHIASQIKIVQDQQLIGITPQKIRDTSQDLVSNSSKPNFSHLTKTVNDKTSQSQDVLSTNSELMQESKLNIKTNSCKKQGSQEKKRKRKNDADFIQVTVEQTDIVEENKKSKDNLNRSSSLESSLKRIKDVQEEGGFLMFNQNQLEDKRRLTMVNEIANHHEESCRASENNKIRSSRYQSMTDSYFNNNPTGAANKNEIQIVEFSQKNSDTFQRKSSKKGDTFMQSPSAVNDASPNQLHQTITSPQIKYESRLTVNNLAIAKLNSEVPQVKRSTLPNQQKLLQHDSQDKNRLNIDECFDTDDDTSIYHTNRLTNHSHITHQRESFSVLNRAGSIVNNRKDSMTGMPGNGQLKMKKTLTGPNRMVIKKQISPTKEVADSSNQSSKQSNKEQENGEDGLQDKNTQAQLTLILSQETQAVISDDENQKNNKGSQDSDRQEGDDFGSIVQKVEKRTMIQKLLYKGYISQEQYICLELLEQGFMPNVQMPSQKTTQLQEDGYPILPTLNMDQLLQSNLKDTQINQQLYMSDTFGRNSLDQQQQHLQHPNSGSYYNKTLSSGFFKQSEAQSPQVMQNKTAAGGGRSISTQNRRRSLLTQQEHEHNHQKGSSRRQQMVMRSNYKVCANNIHVLEKVFDRVYGKKKTVATQCDTAAQWSQYNVAGSPLTLGETDVDYESKRALFSNNLRISSPQNSMISKLHRQQAQPIQEYPEANLRIQSKKPMTKATMLSKHKKSFGIINKISTRPMSQSSTQLPHTAFGSTVSRNSMIQMAATSKDFHQRRQHYKSIETLTERKQQGHHNQTQHSTAHIQKIQKVHRLHNHGTTKVLQNMIAKSNDTLNIESNRQSLENISMMQSNGKHKLIVAAGQLQLQAPQLFVNKNNNSNNNSLMMAGRQSSLSNFLGAGGSSTLDMKPAEIRQLHKKVQKQNELQQDSKLLSVLRFTQPAYDGPNTERQSYK